jgi:hypothetical protein
MAGSFRGVVVSPACPGRRGPGKFARVLVSRFRPPLAAFGGRGNGSAAGDDEIDLAQLQGIKDHVGSLD